MLDRYLDARNHLRRGIELQTKTRMTKWAREQVPEVMGEIRAGCDFAESSAAGKTDMDEELRRLLDRGH